MTDWIIGVMNSLGYVGITLLMFLENLFPPLPSEKIIMPLAGFAAHQGDLRLPYVIVAGIIGSMCGALPWYYAGRYFGEEPIRAFIDRYGKWLTLSNKNVDKASRWFEKRSGKAVFICRLLPGVRTLIAIPAGISKMPIASFVLYATLGTSIWISVLTIAGYFLGRNYYLIEDYAGSAALIVLGAIALGFFFWVWRRKQKRRHRRS